MRLAVFKDAAVMAVTYNNYPGKKRECIFFSE